MLHAANRSGAANFGVSTALLQEQVVGVVGWTPSDFIAGWYEDGTNVSFPIASLADYNLTAENADGATGDARAVMAALCSRMVAWYANLDNQPSAATASIRSRNMLKGSTWAGKDRQVYSIQFYLNYPLGTIADEV